MKRSKVLVLICVVIGGLLLSGCAGFSAKTGKQTAEGMPKLKVVASFYPMYEFAKQVGGEKTEVAVLVPVGVEPHDWEPTPQDMAVLQQARVFVYNGAGFEHWVDEVLHGKQYPALITVETGKDDATESEFGGKDPHVWLDPQAAQHQVNMIRDAFITADPANKSYYEANAAQYNARLAALDEEYKQGLTKTVHKKFITSHAAFGHLAKRYGLEQVAILGLAPHAEPTPERMRSLVEETKKSQLKYVFFETLVSPKVAEIIAREAGAGTLVLNPIEGLTDDQAAAGTDYIALMRENLANLKLALEVY